MARLVIVSNRVAIPGRDGARAGGLEVAIRAALRQRSGLWLGWSGRIASAADDSRTRTSEQGGNTYVVTDLSREDYEEYYNGFANQVLWPILHYRLDLAEFSRRDLTGYMRVNEYFAAELDKLLRPDDLVWVHDYHLIPLARALRARGHKNRIGFFLHVPFPPPEVLTALPNHERLIPALEDFDLVGFQTQNDALNFARYLINECNVSQLDEHTFRSRDRTVRTGVFPAAIETAQYRRLARRAIRSEFVQDVVDSLGGRAQIIGVDRLDYSKGIDLRMEAFERFLMSHPDWRGKVTYLQISPKSRSQIQKYSEMDRQTSATAGRINGAYGEAAWTPIRYVNRAHTRSVLAGLYRASRAALVTPLRDGMNLVAKEFVAAQDETDPGVLILSRFAGAAAECRDALLVNPYDPEAVGSSIARALSMSLEERRDRWTKIMGVLSKNDARAWGERYLEELSGTGIEALPPTQARISRLQLS